MARVFCIVALAACLAALVGCAGPPKEERQIWEQVKLGDIAPPATEKSPRARFLATVYVDIHVVELPAENVDKLEDLWSLLSARPIYMSSYNAFSDNSFRLKFGRMEIWDQVQTALTAAGGQKAATISLPIADNDTSDLTIGELPAGRAISFVDNDLSHKTVTVGPGTLVLRLRAEPIPWARGVRKIIAYPTHTLPVTSAIPQLNLMARRNEVYFAPTAFAAQMGPGDFVILGPDSYTGEQLTLGGLFFNRPQGRLFFDPGKTKPPAQRPAVCLYILICRTISD